MKQKQTTEIQLHAVRKCRKIINPDLDFSEEVNFWHERVNAWGALLNQKQGKVKHLGHCFRNDRSAGIPDAIRLNKEEVEEGLAYAKARQKLLHKEVPALQKVKMRTKHLKAISDGKGAKAKEILRKIHAED